MARKKEQQKNNADNKTVNLKEKHQGVGRATTAARGSRKASEVRDFKDVDDLDSPLNEDVKNVTSSVDGKKRNKKSANSQRRVDVKQEFSQSAQNNHNSSESFEASVSRENETSDNQANDMEKLNSNFSSMANESHADAISRKSQLSSAIMFENLRSSLLRILKKSYEWMERQKPLLARAADNTRSTYEYLRLKYRHTYPVVLRWLGHFGNISLLLSIIWLNCFVRGIDSLLRMGTASFFAVIWFGVLSTIAMAGLMKFLVVLVVAALIGIFVGFIVGLLILFISAAVYLWLYGSFWTTSIVVIFGGVSFGLGRDRLALLLTTAYSMYCAWTYVGWLGIIFGLNLSFFSSDALIYFLKRNMDEQRDKASEQSTGMPGQEGLFKSTGYFEAEQPAGRSAGVASTSGVDSEISSEDEVIRLLNCTDHYSAMGLSRYQEVDVSVLKREYRKKAMLVHPDKNMGNEKAAEAFKKLQNAYEVLLDSLKRKAYDDELRREELLNYFCQFPSVGQKKGRPGFFANGFANSEAEGQDPLGEVRRIACKKCGGFHVWVQTKKSKATSRWCQDCKDYHQAKDGDGWVEQSSQPFLFGMLQKVDAPVAYVCADSKVYNATEWYICQGMRCPVNSHKPSFHVNTSVTRNHNPGKGNRPPQKGGNPPEENMTEEEFFEWLQNAVNSGMFENFAAGGGTPGDAASSSSKQNVPTNSGTSSGKKKKKGKKQW